jgi:hypothetical protein
MSLILSGTDGLSDVDGSAATPAIRGTDANTGIFFPAADTIAFAEGGAEVARFDSSGNFGIGTTSPADMLDVKGNARVGQGQVVATSTVGAVGIYSGITSGSGNAQLKFFGKSVDNTGLTYELGRISGGSFGTFGIDGGLSFSTALNNGSNVLTLSERMRLDASGNLGIGTIAPTANLQIGAADSSSRSIVIHTANQGDARLRFREGGTVASGYNEYSFGMAGLTNGLTFESQGLGEIGRFDSAGNFLIGNATKFGGGLTGLDLNSAGATGITFGKSASVKGYFYLSSDATSFNWASAAGTVINVISNSAGVTLSNGATSWASLSDERKKDIIEPITDAATKVSSLRAVIGKYKADEDGVRRAMLIAQDVQAVLPEAVVENKDGELLLQYTEIIPLLVAAIKEQSALITTLTARITALESA